SPTVCNQRIPRSWARSIKSLGTPMWNEIAAGLTATCLGIVRGRHKGGQRIGVIEVARVSCGTWSISGVSPCEGLPVCFFRDRALSNGERPGANGSLPDLLIALSTLPAGRVHLSPAAAFSRGRASQLRARRSTADLRGDARADQCPGHPTTGGTAD